MKIAVLDRAALGTDLPLEPLAAFGEVSVYENTAPEEVVERTREADVIVVNKVKITDEVFENAKALKLITEFATGYDNIDLVSARAHGVAVCNVPAYSTESVALFTFATVLSLLTHLSEYRDYVASGAYTRSGVANKLTPVYHELSGLTWGIVGAGNIGSRIAEIAKAFGAHVIVNKRTPDPRFACVDIDTLVRKSDIITVHCPLNEGSLHLIDEERLGLMKKTAILVNEARGAVLDEAAVARAVLEGRIGGFGADVYDGEPFSAEHPYDAIKALPNVLLTPHAAWGAYEARTRCLSIVCENITAFFNGKIKNRVDI